MAEGHVVGLASGFMDKPSLYPTEAGVPQGGIGSPVIANLALDGLERLLSQSYPRTTKKGQQAKVHLCRYADDFIITGSSYGLLQEEVKPLVEQFLSQRGLELSPEKTHITHIEDGFDFLGQNVRKYAGKLLIKPARKHVKTCLGKVRQVVKANKQATAANLIVQLNPMSRGWANYHRHVVSKKTFYHVAPPSSRFYGRGPNEGIPRSLADGWQTHMLRPATGELGPSWERVWIAKGNLRNSH